MRPIIVLMVVLLAGCEQNWKCWHEGEMVASGVSEFKGKLPKWAGEGYTQLPNGRVIEGVCVWGTGI